MKSSKGLISHIGLPARLPVNLALVVAPTQRWSRVAGAVADDLHGKHPIEATPYLAGRSICAGRNHGGIQLAGFS